MADWSQLPPELVILIVKHLETRFDILRFRSICSSWRSSITPRIYPLFPTFLLRLNQSGLHSTLTKITRNTSYLIKFSHAPATAHSCWLAKIRDGTETVKTVLLNPLSNSELNSEPLSDDESFPKVLDLTKFQVFELGHEYIGLHDVYPDHRPELLHRDCKYKIVLLNESSTDVDNDDFIMLANFYSLFGCLAVLRSGEKDWTVIKDVKNVQDIISFNGKFYAIDREGRTIVIDRSLNVSFLERVGLGSSYSHMFLVKSVDNLLAVEMFFVPPADIGKKLSAVKALRLNEEGKKWEMVSLSDRILFLNLQQSVSAPAPEFGWGKGNLVSYPKSLYYSLPCPDRYMCVYDLVAGVGSTLDKCPMYRNFFWPPPQWITAPESVI